MAGIDPRITIEEFLDSHDLEYERKDANTFLVSLPGEKKCIGIFAFVFQIM
jgi:hypothetical protein